MEFKKVKGGRYDNILEKGIMEKASFRLKIKIFWAFKLCANLYSVQFLSGNVLSGISDRKRLSWDLLQDASMVYSK